MPGRGRWSSAAVPFAAAVVGTGYLYGGWVDRADLLFGSLAVTGGGAAFAYGVARSRSVLPFRRLAAGCVWLAAWAACLILPAGVRWSLLRWEASRLPVPDDPHLVFVTADPLAYNFQPDFVVQITAPQSAVELREFYRRELAARGWTYREPERFGVSFDVPEEVFYEPAALVHEPEEPIAVFTAPGLMIFRRGGRSLAVQVLPPFRRGWDESPASVRIYPFEPKPPFGG
jgi:hypothetical protein